MTQYQTEEQIVREYDKIVEKWDQFWIEDRKKYPTEIFVNNTDPMKVGDQLTIKVCPLGTWPDLPDKLKLALIDVIIDEEIFDRILEISQLLNKPIKECIALIAQVLIWEQDCDFGCNHELFNIVKESTIKKEMMKKFRLGTPSNCASLLLYPVWKKEGYKTKLQTVYILDPDFNKSIQHYNIPETFCNPMLLKILNNWEKIYERFLKHELFIYGDVKGRNYFKIPACVLDNDVLEVPSSAEFSETRPSVDLPKTQTNRQEQAAQKEIRPDPAENTTLTTWIEKDTIRHLKAQTNGKPDGELTLQPYNGEMTKQMILLHCLINSHPNPAKIQDIIKGCYPGDERDKISSTIKKIQALIIAVQKKLYLCGINPDIIPRLTLNDIEQQHNISLRVKSLKNKK